MRWPTVPLREIAQAIRGVTFKPGDVIGLHDRDAVAVLRTKNIQADLDLSDTWGLPARFAGAGRYLEAGDLLISTANSAHLVGKVCWVPELPWPAVPGGFIGALRADEAKVSARYLYWWAAMPSAQVSIRSCANQTTNIANLSINRLMSLEVPVPPLDEQRRIAAILDQADGLRSARERAVGLMEELGRATFSTMFGDAVTNSKSYPTCTIREIGRVTTGSTPSRSDEGNYGSGMEWVKSDNLNNKSYYVTEAIERLSVKGRSKARVVGPDAILVTCIAGSPDCIGNSGMTDREVSFNQQINALEVQKGDPRFMYAQLRFHKNLVQAVSTNSMKGMVSKGRFEEIALIFPLLRIRFAMPKLKAHSETRSNADDKA